MAGGNRTLRAGQDMKSNWMLSNMPEPLRVICTSYMIDRCLPSFSYAIKELLETHPEIARRANEVYNGGQVEHLEH